MINIYNTSTKEREKNQTNKKRNVISNLKIQHEDKIYKTILPQITECLRLVQDPVA